MAVLGYLPALKRALGLAFCAHFQHDFLNNLLIDKVSMPYLFLPSQGIKQNVLLNQYSDNR